MSSAPPSKTPPSKPPTAGLPISITVLTNSNKNYTSCVAYARPGYTCLKRIEALWRHAVSKLKLNP